MTQRGWSLLGPLTWSSFVTKKVAVTLANGEELRGWLQTVDPVSASLVLVTCREEGAAELQVVMGHAVEEVQVLQDQDPRTPQACFLPPRTQGSSPPRTQGPSPPSLRARRTHIRTWLQKNQVPVEEEGELLRVAGALTLAAPYRPQDCSSANAIVLDRVQRLIQSLGDEAELGPGPLTDPQLPEDP